MNSHRLLALLMCMLLICAMVFGGCNKKDDSQYGNPSSVDEVITQTNATDTSTTPATTDKDADASAPATTAEPTSADSTDTKEIKPIDKRPETNQGNNSSDTPSGKPSNNSGSSDSGNNTMTCTVTVAEKDYKFNLGDKFTYTCFLKTPGKIEDIQAKLKYTNSNLRLLSMEDTDIAPILSKGTAIINTQNSGIVNYNATRYQGIDFSKEGILLTLKFEVVFGGSSSIFNTLEVMTGVDGTLYVDNLKVAKGVTTRETIN